jgi:thiamine-phosphate pyrophosphorylase
VGEALRVLEESCKVLQCTDAPLAGGATAPRASDFARASSTSKQLRYKAYDIARDIVLALERDQLSSQPGVNGTWQPTLCVLITSELCTHMSWQEVARAAIAGGADCLQLREKNLDARKLLLRAKELVQIAAATPAVRVIINDRIDIALASGADGVHLGQNDLPAGDACAIATRAGRGRTAGHRLLIGVSTFSASEARDAADAGADICGVGPMFPTTTKDKPKIAGPAALHRYLLDEASKHVPHLAIGGIQASNVQELRAVGCRGIAVSSVVCNAREPRRVCEQLLIGLRN